MHRAKRARFFGGSSNCCNCLLDTARVALRRFALAVVPFSGTLLGE